MSPNFWIILACCGWLLCWDDCNIPDDSSYHETGTGYKCC